MNSTSETEAVNEVLSQTGNPTPAQKQVEYDAKISNSSEIQMSFEQAMQEVLVSTEEEAEAILEPRRAGGRRSFAPLTDKSRPVRHRKPLEGDSAVIDLRVTSKSPTEGATVNTMHIARNFGDDVLSLPNYTQLQLVLVDGRSLVGYIQRSAKGKVRCYVPRPYVPEGITLKLGYVQSIKVARIIIG